MNTVFVLVVIFIYALGFGFMVFTVLGIRKRTKNKLENELSRLETMKNLIISSGIMTEMEKVKSLINNESLETKYKKWEKQYKKIEKEGIPKVTDKLLEAENLISLGSFKEASYVLARAELDIYYVKTDAELLLENIKDITLSEERNRNAVTKLKTLYREIVTKYNNNKNDYKGMENPIDLQFDNINKLFSAFERVMENHDYEEVSRIVHALDDLIKNIKIVIDETPTVILMCKMIIPKKIGELRSLSSKMKKDGYNIEYINLEYNINEATKKLNDIYDRMKVLNLEDSIFELKTMLDYFESLYGDFDKEKQCKKEYELYINNIQNKINRLTKVVKNIYLELDELKETYSLTNEEIKSLDNLSMELQEEKESFKGINDRTLIRVMPYSKLSKECELLSVKLSKTEDKLESLMKSFGSLKEDEIRARDQLTEIRAILKSAKEKIKEYKLPVVPKTYFVELNEAKEGISSIMEELSKKPIDINSLNTRVDTGRDLVLKLYTLSNDLTRTATLAEMAIVYGNRYRSSYKEVDTGLIKAESEFRKGEYRVSLETSINALSQIEPGIHKKIMNAYKD